MTEPREAPNPADAAKSGRIGYIRLDPGDTDISRQALLLDGIGGFSRVHVEHPPDVDGVGSAAGVWEKRSRMIGSLVPGDVVYAASADRLCAGARDLAAVARAIREAGASLVLLEEGVDTRTSAGRSALKLVESVARADSESASRGRRAGIRRARENGRRIGRPPVAVPPNFREICKEWADGKVPGKQAASSAGMKPTSFYARAAELGYRSPERKKRVPDRD